MATATLQITGGPSFVFAESAGTDAGPFVDPEGQFTQHCIKVERTDTPVAIFFRRDAVTNRFEVVAEYVKIWQAAQPINFGAFTLTITDDANATHVLGASHWEYGARFRFNPTPRAARHTIAELIANGTIANYSAPTIPFKEQYNLDNYVYRNPMDVVGYAQDMSTTGERPELGWDHDVIATAVMANNIAPIAAIAESAASMPCHFRDEHTGAPINFVQYPQAQWAGSGQGTPYIKTAGLPLKAIDPATGQPYKWFLNVAHMPNPGCFIMAKLTGDPYMIEECQFLANAALGWTAWAVPPAGPKIMPEPQTRAIAWGARDICHGANATPAGPLPSWLLPKSVLTTIFSNYHDHFRNSYTLSTDPVRTKFGITIYPGWCSSEEPFISNALARFVELGYTEWLQDFQWKIQNTIAQTNGTSGWDRQFFGEFRFLLGSGSVDPGNGTPGPDFVLDADWAHVWARKAATANIYTLPRSDSTSYGPSLFPGNPAGVAPAYANYHRAALAHAVDLGIPGALACYQFVTNALLATNTSFVLAKWSVVPRGTPTPTPTPTPTVHVFEEAILEDGVPVLKWPIKPHT